jgi:hypothetical protein
MFSGAVAVAADVKTGGRFVAGGGGGADGLLLSPHDATMAATAISEIRRVGAMSVSFWLLNRW